MWKYILPLLTLFILSCGKANDVNNPVLPPITNLTYADANATQATRNLLKNLMTIGSKGTMFGHQNTTLYGTNWNGDPDRSDIKSVCGSYPAVYGWEIGKIELDKSQNLDGESFIAIRSHLIAAYERGGVNTITWHSTNPVTGGDSWDTTPAVKTIIPGGKNHEMYKGWLDKVATFMFSLKGIKGELIPVLFRPFHEHTGNGFWWGKGNCSATEYVALWKFTVQYLSETKGVHNLLYVYSPDIISSQTQYLEFWPGDESVDMLGLDAYDRSSYNYAERGLQMIRLGLSIAKAKNKPMAFTETGLQNNSSDAKWWTEKLLKVIKGQPVAYVLIWRNASPYHFFGPYPGCVSEADFKSFADDPSTLFGNDIPNMYK